MTECGKCGLNHRVLGVKIRGNTLIRRARASRHLLHLGGGAWGFLAPLLDRHTEVLFVEVEDAESGAVYVATRPEIEKHAFRRDLGAGTQLIVPLFVFEVGHVNNTEVTR